MAAPVADFYGCPSGGVIAGGRAHWFAWRRAMLPKTWATLGSNTMADVDPALDALVNPNYPNPSPWVGMNGHPSVISAWGGGAWNEATKKLAMTGGGHGDYAGNELYEWDASTATFSRLNNPSGAIGNTGTLGDGLDATTSVYFDGQPRSAHTYCNLVMRNGILWNGQGSTYSNGDGKNSLFRFEGGTWVRDSAVEFAASYGTMIYSQPRDRFYRLGSGNQMPQYYDPTTHAVGQMTHWTNNDTEELVAVLDPVRDIVLQFSRFLTLFPLNDTSDGVAMVQSGTIPDWSLNEQHNPSRAAVVYDAARDRFLVWVGGASLYILTPPTVGSNYLTATWVWSVLTPDGANAVSPSAPSAHGTYGRFWYSPTLNCVGMVNAVNQKMHVFALE